MDSERTVAAKTRSRERSATEVAAAAEMHPAAEMPAAMAATMKMPPASVATTMTTSAMTTAATFRRSIAGGRQYGR
jgi:hypothetical protein